MPTNYALIQNKDDIKYNENLSFEQFKKFLINYANNNDYHDIDK